MNGIAHSMDRGIQTLSAKDYYRAFNIICSLIRKYDDENEKSTKKDVREKRESQNIIIQKSKL